MKKHRIIPFLLYKDGYIVQSRNFKHHKKISKAHTVLSRLSAWDADEVCLVNISSSASSSDFQEAVALLSRSSSMPLCVGGGITTVEQGLQLIRQGADKIYINRLCINDPSKVVALAKVLGSQAIVASVQYQDKDGHRIIRYGASDMPNIGFINYIKHLESLGVGEISLVSETRDGLATGFDNNGISIALQSTTLPIVPFGGGRHPEHFLDAFQLKGLEALAAGNIFHFSEQSYYLLNKYLLEYNLPVRSLQFS